MLMNTAALALRDIFSPPFRRILAKSLALTIGLLVSLWIVLEWLLSHVVALPYDWLDSGFSVLVGIGLVIALGFLVAPVTALFAGLFLDEIAELVERTHYPDAPPGRPLPIGRSVLSSAKFFGVVLLVNAIALPLVIFVGFGVVVFLVANAYLLGREYFELAALRFHDEATVRRLRAHHSTRIFAGGLIVAGFLAIPLVNILAPLFATAFMVHLNMRVIRLEMAPAMSG
jgi:CysZ protein